MRALWERVGLCEGTVGEGGTVRALWERVGL